MKILAVTESYDQREARLEEESGKIEVRISISRRFLAYQCIGADVRYWSGRTAKWQSVGDLSIITHIGEVDERTGKVIANHKCDWARAIKLAAEKHPHLLDDRNMNMSTGDEWVQLAALGELRYG